MPAQTTSFELTGKQNPLKRDDCQKRYYGYKKLIDRRLASLFRGKKPQSLYEPVRYITSSGGKRVRALLTLLSCEAVGGRPHSALDAAAAIEILHTFTLVHDDVMDRADVRRGHPTIHKKWDPNVAILAGDALVAAAYLSLLKTGSGRLRDVVQTFTDAFVQVCEGQGLDKEFESRRDVEMREYLVMIGKKTGRMISAAAEIGALIGGGSSREISALRSYGEHLGRAFQIRDDLLDIVGTEREFGKPIGGDVSEGKKTYMLLRAIERATGEDRTLLRSLAPGTVSRGGGGTARGIRRVRDIYERTGVLEEARAAIARSTRLAQRSLASLNRCPAREMLVWLSLRLLDRGS